MTKITAELTKTLLIDGAMSTALEQLEGNIPTSPAASAQRRRQIQGAPHNTTCRWYRR